MEDIYLIPIKLKPFNFTINNIYLKTRELNYSTYKNSNIKIDIKLKEKENKTYD